MNDVLDAITLNDLDEEQRELAEVIGLIPFKELVRNYGGTYLYVQKLETFERAVRNTQIKEEFNGYNYKKLAHKFKLTEIQIRSIVKDIEQQKKGQPADGQISIFDVI